MKNKKYTEVVTIRLTEQQYERIKEHAKADGLTISKLLRNRATLYCDKD